MSSIPRTLSSKAPYSATINQLNSVLREINKENRFEIVSQGVASVPANTVTAGAAGFFHDNDSVVITHNLGYVPIVQAYILLEGGANRLPLPYTQTDVTPIASIDFYVWDIVWLDTASTVTFRSSALISANTATAVTFGGVSVQYYLLREKAGTV